MKCFLSQRNFKRFLLLCISSLSRKLQSLDHEPASFQTWPGQIEINRAWTTNPLLICQQDFFGKTTILAGGRLRRCTFQCAACAKCTLGCRNLTGQDLVSSSWLPDWVKWKRQRGVWSWERSGVPISSNWIVMMTQARLTCSFRINSWLFSPFIKPVFQHLSFRPQ